MAHSKSALKRQRNSVKANARNRARIGELKTIEKKLRAAVAAGEKDASAQLAKDFCSCLDKAAKVGTIHVNRVARKKSQADKLINSVAK